MDFLMLFCIYYFGWTIILKAYCMLLIVLFPCYYLT